VAAFERALANGAIQQPDRSVQRQTRMQIVA
jgi:hypothetical protein